MIVMKFGGTSAGSAAAIERLRCEAENCPQEAIVVVSAFDGITDSLIATAECAARGGREYEPMLGAIMERHRTMLRECVAPDRRGETEPRVEQLLEELSNILRGISLIGDLSVKTLEAIESYGERLSAEIVTGAVRGAVLYDPRNFIKTRNYYGRHIVDFETTYRLIAETFSPMPHLAVVGGFYASDAATGDITNLGRGGSDYTASLLAAGLDASVLQMWTDVDGFQTADPRIVRNAYTIGRLSFGEAMELCNFGARVVHPPTIFPVYHKDIPIVIRNSFNPAGSGTIISSDGGGTDSERPVKGISSINDTSLITLRGLGMVGVIGINRRIFRTLAEAGISVFFVSQASSENSTSIGVRNGDAEHAREVLSAEFRQEIESGEINPVAVEHDLATVAIVGEQMKGTPGVAGKLFGTLGRNGINVVACAQGAAETNISFVVRRENLEKTINVIHDSFFLSEYQVLNIFLAGVGLVGSSLLEQIRQQQPKLLKNNSLQIRVVGITNSRRYIIDPDGIDLGSYASRLADTGTPSDPGKFCDEIIRLNLYNPVFVDCTASSDVAAVYRRLLEHNVSVVAANKIAASSSYDSYAALKQAARNSGVKYLFETNVGAGLPIINTIGSLRNSGDRILRIEAVVSGTLNYIFNVLGPDVPLSRAIRMAQEAGYAEPDPRIDLSGTDVIRKLVILAREAGYPLEQNQVEKSLFIPAEYFAGSVEDFWSRISELDARFEAGRRELAAAAQKWRFVATLDGGEASVALRRVGPESPFYHLEGSNNAILLTTERYKEYPMQIKGYGAGASVTAAGVFADIISIANIR